LEIELLIKGKAILPTLVEFMEVCNNCIYFVEKENPRIGWCNLYNVPVYFYEKCILFVKRC